MAKEFFAVLCLAMTDAGEGIPSSYLTTISKIDSKLAEQLTAVVTTSSDSKGEQQWRQMLDSLARLDKLKEKELYLSSNASQLSESTGERLNDEIKKSLGRVGKYVKAYNRMIAASKPLRRNELFTA